ncbi:MAG: hypothetical protein M3540_01295 [Actinomycetota bacterium]|nr:hypothetical protein [Actinomycetota bacterium]
MLTPQDALKARRLKQLGIVNPALAIEAAKKAGLELAVACAFLEQESGGGHNVFGHDRDGRGNFIFPAKDGVVPVTEQLYKEYKARRGAEGKGGMQGVGPLQLTWFSFQDAADKQGGCWNPRANMAVGFAHAAALIRRNGMQLGVKSYNGSGPAADRYLAQMLPRIEKWRRQLKTPAKAQTGTVVKKKKPAKVILNPRDWWKKFVYGDADCERPLLCALANVAQGYGQGARVFVRCGTRTFEEQTALYRIYQRDGRPLTARPGTSNHEVRPPGKEGCAADCQIVYANGSMADIGNDKKARELLKKRGLCLPVPGEAWHVERGTVWKA